MTVKIRSLEMLDNPVQLQELVRAYLEHEISELHRISGLSLDVNELVAATFDNISDYLPPAGRLLLAVTSDTQLQGCVFLKRIRPDACEIKRLFVQPKARGKGLGRRLMDNLLDEARSMGAAHILLDTGIYDKAAQALYCNLGFHEIDAYPEGENDPSMAPHLVFMQLDL